MSDGGDRKSTWVQVSVAIAIMLLALLWFTFFGDEAPGPHTIGEPIP